MATGTAAVNPRRHHYEQVHFLRKKLTYASDDIAVDVGRIPAYSTVVGGGVHVVTAFNDSGTDVLDVGFRGAVASDDPDGYSTDLALDGVGYIVLDELAATTNILSTQDCIVTATYAGQNGNATAGEAYLTIMYVHGFAPAVAD